MVRDTIQAAMQVAGLHAFSVVPERAVPPMAWVAPGDPYVTREGATFGGEIVRHEVVLVAPAGVNEVMAGELDELIVTALDALEANPDLFVSDVGQPGRIQINGQQYLAAAIAVSTEIRR